MRSGGTLAPRLRQRVVEAVRGPGWRRMALARRAAAGLLAALALVLAVAPGEVGVPVLVAARDLVPGSRLAAADVVVRRWPAEQVPAGVVADPQLVDGRVLAGAARAGEVLTDVRLVGPELAASLHSAPDSAAVPVRLADAQVAGLLVPGSRVDVVAPSARGEPVVLAEAAAVLAVLPPADGPGQRGRLVLVAMSQALATRVAAAALTEQVAITLR
ncbi:SAF domain-containing protein [Pseudonocardia sp.]|uniref:SAF domain-containing protein n=1 Tax=Pseudonocardia sp. TaxID=60912 RepID=UPI003D148C6C